MCKPRLLLQWKDGHAKAFHVRCKQWRCPDCRPKLRRKLRAIAFAGAPTTFITLTSNPKYGRSPAHRAWMLVRALRTLKRMLHRFEGVQRFEYFAVIEATKRGEPHLHVLARCPYIPQKVLSYYWGLLTGATVVHIERVTSARGASAYVAKYTSKDPADFRGRRRYNRSRGYALERREKPPPSPLKGCELRELKADIAWIAVAWSSSGWAPGLSNSEYIEATCPGSRDPPPFWELALPVIRTRRI